MPPTLNGNVTFSIKWLGIALAIAMAFSGAVATVYSTFETKVDHRTDFEKIDAKLDRLIWFHVQMQRTGREPNFEGPHIAEGATP